MPRSATAPMTRCASTARNLRAKVVGEGANLGVTQRGRIAYALKGGRIDTDAIDNSAGVDTSDHEVNHQDPARRRDRGRRVSRRQERDTLLAQMTDDVAALVLRDNYLQGEALSLAEARGAERARPPGAADPRSRARRPARPRARVPARRRGAGGARRRRISG